MADAAGGIRVSPHNPTGPVATAASAQLCATLGNLAILEHQWGEVGWRGELVSLPESFAEGSLTVSVLPGLGVELDEAGLRARGAVFA